jgi:hypothetical protein
MRGIRASVSAPVVVGSRSPRVPRSALCAKIRIAGKGARGQRDRIAGVVELASAGMPGSVRPVWLSIDDRESGMPTFHSADDDRMLDDGSGGGVGDRDAGGRADPRSVLGAARPGFEWFKIARTGEGGDSSGSGSSNPRSALRAGKSDGGRGVKLCVSYWLCSALRRSLRAESTRVSMGSA